MLSTRSWTKRPREALLQLVIGFRPRMFSVGGSFGANETPPLRCLNSNPVTSQVAKVRSSVSTGMFFTSFAVVAVTGDSGWWVV